MPYQKTNQSQYEKIPSWDYKNDGTGSVLEGTITDIRTANTKYGMKKIWVFDCAGTKKELWETTVLAGALKDAVVGTKAKLTYTGLGKATKGNPPHLFDVEIWVNE